MGNFIEPKTDLHKVASFSQLAQNIKSTTLSRSKLGDCHTDCYVDREKETDNCAFEMLD